MTKICPNCGSIVDDNLSICNNCGLTFSTKQVPYSNDIVEAITTPIEEDNNENIPSSFEMAFDQLPIINDENNQNNLVNETQITVNENQETINMPGQEEQIAIPEVNEEVNIQDINISDQTNNQIQEVITQPNINMDNQQTVETGKEIQSEITNPVVETEKTISMPVQEKQIVIPEVNEEVNIQDINIPDQTNNQIQEVITQPDINMDNQQTVEIGKEIQSEMSNPVVETQETTNIPVQEESIAIPEVNEEVNIQDINIPDQTNNQIQEVITQPDINVDNQQTVETGKEIQSEMTNPVVETQETTNIPVQEESIAIPEVNIQNTEEDNGKSIPNVILDTNTVIDVPEGIEEVSINDLVNNDLESVSVKLEDEVQEVDNNIEEVVLPEATIGEVDPNILNTIYEQEEKRNENNKELLAKEEEDRKRREEEARIAKQKMEPKPDLMAKVDYVISNDETSKKKEKKKKSGFLKFLIIIILMLICAGICWFIFIKDNNNKEETYEKMVQNYYKYIEKQDKSGIISTYIPCTTKDENITSEINNKLNSYNQLGDFKIEYKINSVENVNEEERNSIKTSSIGTYCEIDNIPEITDYKHLYISQTLITDERTTTDIELWVVQINNKWYIVPTDENI